MKKFLLISALALSSVNAYANDTTTFDTELNCMAMNMYFESKNQPDIDMYAVGHVVLNRMKSDKFPIRVDGKIASDHERSEPVNTICNVVKDAKLDTRGNPIRNGCQFSWYCDGKREIILSKKRWNKALEIAEDLMIDRYYEYDFTGGALWYHADYVTPSWAKSKTKTIQIYTHIYYK